MSDDNSKLIKCAKMMGHSVTDTGDDIIVKDLRGNPIYFRPLSQGTSVLALICELGIDIYWYEDKDRVIAQQISKAGSVKVHGETISSHGNKELALAHAVVNLACVLYDSRS